MSLWRHGNPILQGHHMSACAEFGCWEGAQGSVQKSATFMRRAISYMDSDPRVLKCAPNPTFAAPPPSMLSV